MPFVIDHTNPPTHSFIPAAALSSTSTLNPFLPPFVPRATATPSKRSAVKKRLRLLRFPLSLRFIKLNNAQKAAIRVARKASVKRLRQLELLQEYVADTRLKIQDVVEQQSALFKQIASLHRVVVETETEASLRRERQVLGKRKRQQELVRAISSFASTSSCRFPTTSSNLPPSFQDQG